MENAVFSYAPRKRLPKGEVSSSGTVDPSAVVQMAGKRGQRGRPYARTQGQGLTARILLGDDDGQIKDLSGQDAVSGGTGNAPEPAADSANSQETQTLASLNILVPVATTWSKPWTNVPDDMYHLS